MCMFRRPFQDTTREGVYQKIIDEEPKPFPENFSTDLKQLSKLMLQKDPKKRPSSHELAKIPFIKKSIMTFAEEYDCREHV